jgi:uncharacterized protein (DUF302 family)
VGKELVIKYLCIVNTIEMDFDNKAKDWDKDPKKVERARIFAREISIILGDRKDITALEFGSGTGLVSFELTGRFSSITLADSSKGMLEVLKQKIEREKITIMKPFFVSDSDGLRDLRKFDVIYTLLTLHHVKDIPDLISEFSRLLNPGGFLFIGDLITEDGSFHSSDPEFDGHRGFEPEELEKMCQVNGFGKCNSKIFYNIERENNSIVRSYPLFLLSAQKSNNMKAKDSSAMLLESQSNLDFSTTVEKISAAVTDSGWKIPATHDLQNTIKNFGKDILPVKILEICHPKHSSRLLELDNERIVSTFMPCRISVYEKSDGKVYISRINAALLSKSFGGLVEEVMTAANDDMEKMIAPFIR